MVVAIGLNWLSKSALSLASVTAVKVWLSLKGFDLIGTVIGTFYFLSAFLK